MMSQLSLLSLFLLFVGYALGDSTTSSPVTVTNTTMNLNSKATLDSKTTPSHQTTLIPTMSPSSQTTSHSNPKTTLKTQISKTTSHSNLKTTLKTTATSKTGTSMSTSMKNDGTTLNPRDNIHFLFYVVFLLFCVH